MRLATVSFLLAIAVFPVLLGHPGLGSAAADSPAPPVPDQIRAGLTDRGRPARERAERAVSAWARTHPAAAAALWKTLDARGRRHLLRGIATAGTPEAGAVALDLVVGASDQAFGALLRGLVAGGKKSLFAAAPKNLPAARREALDQVRLRWRLERELARLKSRSGLTGHYQGQFKTIRKLGPDVVPVLVAMFLDRAYPFPGEVAAGTYESIHPWMVRFEKDELRNLAGYSFGEVVNKDDLDTIVLLLRVFGRMFQPHVKTESRAGFETWEQAPTLAYSLFDLGVKGPVKEYIAQLDRRARSRNRFRSWEADRALWDLGYALIRIGRHEEGERKYEQLIQTRPRASRVVACYNLACNFSIRAAREPRRREEFVHRAIKYLDDAVFRYKYTDWQWMEEDKDLSFVRQTKGYQRVLSYLRKKYPARPKGRIPKELREFLDGK